MSTMGAHEHAARDNARSIQVRFIGPHEANYSTRATATFNAMIGPHPPPMARCATHNVVQTIGFARQHTLPLAIRGGGRTGAGPGSVDDIATTGVRGRELGRGLARLTRGGET